MTVKDLCEKYNKLATDKLKADFVKNNVEIKKYLSYANKAAMTESIARASTRKVDDKGGYTNEIKLDSALRHLLFTLNIIKEYTNIEVNFNDILSEYDGLMSNGIFFEIVKEIPQNELESLQAMLSAQIEDIIENEFSTQAFIRNQVERFGTLLSITLSPVLDKLSNEIKDLDDNKIIKLGEVIGKYAKRGN